MFETRTTDAEASMDDDGAAGVEVVRFCAMTETGFFTPVFLADLFAAAGGKISGNTGGGGGDDVASAAEYVEDSTSPGAPASVWYAGVSLPPENIASHVFITIDAVWAKNDVRPDEVAREKTNKPAENPTIRPSAHIAATVKNFFMRGKSSKPRMKKR